VAAHDRLLTRLALASLRHPWRVLLAWLVVGALAAWSAAGVQAGLKGEVGGTPGTVSDLVARRMVAEFDFPFVRYLVVTLQAPAPALAGGRDAVVAQLTAAPGVRGVREVEAGRPGLALLLVGLQPAAFETEEAAVPVVRDLVARALAGREGVRAATTGMGAFNHDMVTLGSAQGSASEARVMPAALAVLVVAFGSVLAALTPLVTGLATVLLAMGALGVLVGLMPVSVYAANVVTMLGLSLGIDYALLLVARHREERARDPHGALERAVSSAVPVVTTAAVAVFIGLAALVTFPIRETVGLGVGGMLVVTASLVSTLTLLPAVLALARPWLERRPPAPLEMGPSRWARWGAHVVARPWLALALALGCLLTLAAPLGRYATGFPDLSLVPRQLESVQGYEALRETPVGGALQPAQLLLTAPAGEAILTPRRLLAMRELVQALRAMPEVQDVVAIAAPSPTFGRLLVASQLLPPARLLASLPAEPRGLVSRDGRATLIQVVPKAALRLAELRALGRTLRTRDWGAIRGLAGVEVLTGGPSAVENDMIDAANAALPLAGGLILGATVLSLALLTRSVLIPLKAALCNVVTVAAAAGATVFLFGHPVTAAWLGLAGPVTSFPAIFPLMLCSLLFGLSMDYEVILIRRIHEAHVAGADDATAIVEGLGRSGPVITWAAVLMAVVFVGFALTDLVPVKLIGVGLAIGVLLDATVTRLLLVPATMRLLGRANWYPG
jgi:RND superfamily putative drug exporter